MSKIVFWILILLFAGRADGQNPWWQLDTLTTGMFNDINPQVDHAGLGIINVGLYSGPLTGEWVVFERWHSGNSSITSLRFNVDQSKWDTSVSTISPAVAGTVQEFPDICTNPDSTSACAWQEKSDSVWNIYYSTCKTNTGTWSMPVALTNDSVSNTNVKVRAISLSSFIVIWRRGRCILYSTLQNGEVSLPETLAVSNFDSTDYDLSYGTAMLPGQGEFAWTVLDSSGRRICLVSNVSNLSGMSLSPPDTISCTGDIGSPRFMIEGTSFSLTFNLLKNGTQEAWGASYRFLGYPSNTFSLSPEQLAADDNSSYSNAVLFVPPLLEGVSKSMKKTNAIYPWGIYAWQKESSGDTSVVFAGDNSDSLENGSNPSISPLTFFVGNKTSLGFVIWESNRSGSYHLYMKTFYWVQTGINETGQNPSYFNLLQNYPNPFNPSTTIGYELSGNSFVSLKVYDVLGREVTTLVNARQTAGNHSATFRADDLPSGVYFYRLEAGTYSATKKMLLLK